MGLRTVVLKLHKPGKNKREILDAALRNYNKAYRFLLARAHPEAEEIREKFKDKNGLYTAGVLSKWVGGELSAERNGYNVQPFKDSLKLELGMTLASYFELAAVKDGVGFPKAGGGPDPGREAPEGAESGKDGLGDAEKWRPVYFCRYDRKRSYCLLYNRESNRYFAKLYLMNSACARPAADRKDEKRELTYIHKDSGVLEKGQKKETFIVVPLSFGKYQEEFLKAALEKPESLRTARLLKKSGGYYLAVSIDTGKAGKIGTETFLGVARGIKNQLNCTVVDAEGNSLYSGAIPHPPVDRGGHPVPLHELHSAANHIADLALAYKSRVILQNLLEKGDGLCRDGDEGMEVQPAYKCRTYIQLTKLLEYKLPEKGLPLPVKVSSTDIFYHCPACGFYSSRNRLTRELLLCTKCGATMEIESLGSLNLARKLIQYGRSKIKIKTAKTSEGVWFTNKLLGLRCFVPYTEDPLEKLREEIQRIVQDIDKSRKSAAGKESATKTSIIKKFEGSEDFMGRIEFV